MNKKNVLVALCFVTNLFGFAQIQEKEADSIALEEVTVTDSRFALKRENSGKTVVKITAKELKQKAGQTISQIINTKSGITINGSNSQAGQPLGTYVRGGQNRQVLVLIDGVAVNDASQIENNFDLQLLALDQIESIEILKGASSALYGNRASTAVINITLKRARKESIKANFSSFLGTNNGQNDKGLDIADFKNSIGLSGTVNKFNYTTNFSSTFTNGLSAVREVEGAPANESDKFSKINGSLKLGYDFTDGFTMSAFLNYDKYRTAFDNGYLFVNENNLSNNKQVRFGISPKFAYKNGSVQINASLSNLERESESSSLSTFDAETLVIDAFNKYKFNDKLYTIIGLNLVKNKMNNTSDFSLITEDFANDLIIDPYVSATYISDFGFNTNVGVRLNNHSEYGSNFVFNVNPSYVFKLNEASVKLLASYSTAYVTPSLYQLFEPFIGNQDLTVQEDQTIEAGFDVKFNDKLNIRAIYFHRNQDNYIDYVTTDFITFAGQYQNLEDDFKVQGVEAELSYKPLKKLNLNANYTFTERKDGVIFRVPKQKANANIDYALCAKTNMSLSYQFNSDRTSPFFNDSFTANRVLASYNLVNFNINHKVLDNKMTLYAGVTNLLNEDYEELYRFSTLGRNFRVGFNLSL